MLKKLIENYQMPDDSLKLLSGITWQETQFTKMLCLLLKNENIGIELLSFLTNNNDLKKIIYASTEAFLKQRNKRHKTGSGLKKTKKINSRVDILVSVLNNKNEVYKIIIEGKVEEKTSCEKIKKQLNTYRDKIQSDRILLCGVVSAGALASKEKSDGIIFKSWEQIAVYLDNNFGHSNNFARMASFVFFSNFEALMLTTEYYKQDLSDMVLSPFEQIQDNKDNKSTCDLTISKEVMKQHIAKYWMNTLDPNVNKEDAYLSNLINNEISEIAKLITSYKFSFSRDNLEARINLKNIGNIVITVDALNPNVPLIIYVEPHGEIMSHKILELQNENKYCFYLVDSFNEQTPGLRDSIVLSNNKYVWDWPLSDVDKNEIKNIIIVVHNYLGCLT